MNHYQNMVNMEENQIQRWFDAEINQQKQDLNPRLKNDRTGKHKRI